MMPFVTQLLHQVSVNVEMLSHQGVGSSQFGFADRRLAFLGIFLLFCLFDLVHLLVMCGKQLQVELVAEATQSELLLGHLLDAKDHFGEPGDTCFDCKHTS